MVPRVMMSVAVPIKSLVLIVVMLVEMVRTSFIPIFKVASSPVQFVLFFLEGIVAVPIVIESIEVMKIFNFLNSTAIHIVDRLRSSLSFLASFFKHLIFPRRNRAFRLECKDRRVQTNYVSIAST